MKKYNKKKYLIYILLAFAILDYELLFCNSNFIGDILKFNFNFSIYVFSWARIFIYVLFFIIAYFVKDKIIKNRLDYEEKRNKKNITDLIFFGVQIFTIIVTIYFILAHQISIMSLGVIILIFIYFLFLSMFYSANFKLDILMICSIIFIFCISTDVIHPIDEVTHFSSAYNLSQFNFDFSKSYGDGNLEQIHCWGNFNSNKEFFIHYSPEKYEVEAKIDDRWPSEDSKYLYIPSAVGIFIAQTLNGTIMDTFYMGRIFNALILLTGIALLLKIIPFKLNCFVAVITTPYFLLMGGTYNVDGIGGISILLFIAYILKLYNDKNIKKLTLQHIGKIVLLMLVIIFFKSAGYFFVFLLLILLRKKLSKHQRIFIGFLVFLPLIILYFKVFFGNVNTSDSRGGDTNTFEQLHFLFSSPFVFFKVYFLHTMNTFFNPAFYSELNRTYFFGNFSQYFTIIYIFYLFYMGISSNDHKFKWQETLLIGLIFCLLFYFTSTALYLQFTPVNTYIIKGYQARYVWPIIPLLLMLSNNEWIGINKNKDYRRFNLNFVLIITILFLYSDLYYKILFHL